MNKTLGESLIDTIRVTSQEITNVRQEIRENEIIYDVTRKSLESRLKMLENILNKLESMMGYDECP